MENLGFYIVMFIIVTPERKTGFYLAGLCIPPLLQKKEHHNENF